MAIWITNNESNASRRVVPISAISASNGTSPSTNEAGGQPQWMMGGVYKGNTSGTLSAASANRGEYFVVLTASEVSVIGQGAVYYSSTTALEWSTPFQVVAYDSGDSVGLGLSGVTVGKIVAGTYSGVTVGSLATIVAGDYGSSITFGVSAIKAGTYSGVTVGSLATIVAGDYSSSITFGVGAIKAGTYSGVTVGINNIAAGTYSGATVGINNIAAGSYSGVTISGVTASNVLDKTGYALAAGDFSSTITVGVSKILAGTYSGVTVGSAATILAGTYSGVTLGINNIAAGTYSGVTTSGFDSGGNQAVANSLLSTNVGNSRLVQEYLWPARNKVFISGSVMTVFKPDDVTSSWTASVTTGTITITTMDPQG